VVNKDPLIFYTYFTNSCVVAVGEGVLSCISYVGMCCPKRLELGHRFVRYGMKLSIICFFSSASETERKRSNKKIYQISFDMTKHDFLLQICKVQLRSILETEMHLKGMLE